MPAPRARSAASAASASPPVQVATYPNEYSSDAMPMAPQTMNATDSASRLGQDALGRAVSVESKLCPVGRAGYKPALRGPPASRRVFAAERARPPADLVSQRPITGRPATAHTLQFARSKTVSHM